MHCGRYRRKTPPYNPYKDPSVDKVFLRITEDYHVVKKPVILPRMHIVRDQHGNIVQQYLSRKPTKTELAYMHPKSTSSAQQSRSSTHDVHLSSQPPAFCNNTTTVINDTPSILHHPNNQISSAIQQQQQQQHGHVHANKRYFVRKKQEDDSFCSVGYPSRKTPRIDLQQQVYNLTSRMFLYLSSTHVYTRQYT